MGAVKTLLERCCWQTEGVSECVLEGEAEVRERLKKGSEDAREREMREMGEKRKKTQYEERKKEGRETKVGVKMKSWEGK